MKRIILRNQNYLQSLIKVTNFCLKLNYPKLYKTVKQFKHVYSNTVYRKSRNLIFKVHNHCSLLSTQLNLITSFGFYSIKSLLFFSIEPILRSNRELTCRINIH